MCFHLILYHKCLPKFSSEMQIHIIANIFNTITFNTITTITIIIKNAHKA